MLTLFTFRFAKRRIQFNVARRTHIRKFRTQTTSVSFLTVYADTRARVDAWLVLLNSSKNEIVALSSAVTIGTSHLQKEQV